MPPPNTLLACLYEPLLSSSQCSFPSELRSNSRSGANRKDSRLLREDQASLTGNGAPFLPYQVIITVSFVTAVSLHLAALCQQFLALYQCSRGQSSQKAECQPKMGSMCSQGRQDNSLHSLAFRESCTGVESVSCYQERLWLWCTQSKPSKQHLHHGLRKTACNWQMALLEELAGCGHGQGWEWGHQLWCVLLFSKALGIFHD